MSLLYITGYVFTMVMYCCVYGCTNNGTMENISFHKFPMKDPHRMKLWLAMIRRESSYQPTEFSAICSDHFTADCYLRPPTSKMPRLRPTAVPTVFAHNPPVKERSSSALEKRELYKVWCYWLQLHKVNALLIICTDTTKACKHKWICYRYLWLLLYRNNMKHFISDVSYNT